MTEDPLKIFIKEDLDIKPENDDDIKLGNYADEVYGILKNEEEFIDIKTEQQDESEVKAFIDYDYSSNHFLHQKSNDQFNSNELQIIHKRTVKNKCKLCNALFKTCYQLERHLEVHSEQEERLKYHVNCDVCKQKYSSQEILTGHRKILDLIVKCDNCGVKCLSSRNLKVPIRLLRTETDRAGPPFICESCGKDFQRKRDMEEHKMNVHLKLRPYNCRYGCDKNYNDRRNRNQHEKQKHGQTFEKIK